MKGEPRLRTLKDTIKYGWCENWDCVLNTPAMLTESIIMLVLCWYVLHLVSHFFFGEEAPYKSWMDALNLCFRMDLKDAVSLTLSEVKKMTLSEGHKDSEMSRFICVNLGNGWKNADAFPVGNE